jgi:hypothetical protein
LSDELKNIASFKAPIPGMGGGATKTGTDAMGSSTLRDLEVRYKRDSIQYFKTFKEREKTFKVFAGELSNITRGMLGIGTNLLKLAAGGALGGAAGILGGVMPLAKSAIEDRRAALQLGGANIGKMKAAGLAFGNILNVPDEVSKIAGAQFNRLDPAYMALTMMGFSDEEIQGSDPSDLLAKALRVEQRRMKKYGSKELAVTIEGAQGITNLFDPSALRTLYGLPKGELEDRQKQYQSIQKTLDLTEKEQRAIDELVRHITTAGEQIETVMTKNLAKMSPYLTEFSDWIADFVVNRIPHDEGGLAKEVGKNTIKDFIMPFFKMNEAIDKWFGGLFSGAKQKTEEDFTAALKAFTDWVKKYLPDVSALAAPGDPNFPGRVGAPSVGGAGGRIGHGRSGPNAGMTGVEPPSAEITAALEEAKKSGKFPDTIAGHMAFIKTMAPKYGIDPNFALDVARSEGLFSKSKSQGSYVDVDPKTGRPYTFWDFQLNYRKGVGTFAAREGIDPDKPEDWMKADEFALRWMAKHGMGDWRTDAAFRKYGGQVKHVPVEAPKLPDALRENVAPKGRFHYHDPNNPIFDYPSPTEKVAPQSMNDMRQFQRGDLGFRVLVSNPAGANVAVSSGMLGASFGNFGNG